MASYERKLIHGSDSEFRAVRAEHEFFTICRTPELACEITLQPIRRYTGLVDASIIFSDILVIPQAMGLVVEMLPGKGPSFPEPLKEPKDISRLTETVDIEKELGYVCDAITLTRKKLDGEVPLIGFCGAPWTLFAYMIEGGGSKTLQLAKTWIFKHPNESKELLNRIAVVCADFLVAQIKAGAQVSCSQYKSHSHLKEDSSFKCLTLGLGSFRPQTTANSPCHIIS
jgi:uroporphyrinogen decarboxylase